MGLQFGSGNGPAGAISFSLNSGGVMLVPQGNWKLNLSKYHNYQRYDPTTTTWRAVGSANEGAFIEDFISDGVNHRITNQTGCPIGALLTAAGSGYTSPPTVTASAGGSIWKAIVGGAISTTVTIVNGGLNYTYPPLVIFSLPPAPGVQATGYATLAGGVVTSITVVDQGAGYLSPPTITLANDSRELASPNLTDGVSASAVATLVGAQTVTAVLCVDHGQGNQAVLPTLTFAGGGGSAAAATVIMNWSIATFIVGTAGAGLSGAFAQITALDSFPATAPAYTNPTFQSNLLVPRQATIKAVVTAGALVLAGSTILDGGTYSAVPIALVYPTASVITIAPVVTFTMGGYSGVTFLTPV